MNTKPRIVCLLMYVFVGSAPLWSSVLYVTLYCTFSTCFLNHFYFWLSNLPCWCIILYYFFTNDRFIIIHVMLSLIVFFSAYFKCAFIPLCVCLCIFMLAPPPFGYLHFIYLLRVNFTVFIPLFSLFIGSSSIIVMDHFRIMPINLSMSDADVFTS